MRRTLLITTTLVLLMPTLIAPGSAEAPSGYSWTFDLDAEGWTATRPSGATQWALYADAANGPGLGWATNPPGTDYGNDLDTRLTSPALDLSGMATASLVFNIRGSAEIDWDFLFIEARETSSSSWTTLMEIDSAFSDWHAVDVRLGALAGASAVEVRFRFDSDGSVVGDGYFLDDIAVAMVPDVGLVASQRHVALGTTITFDATITDGGAVSGTLDLADGTSVPVTTGTTSVTHTYADVGNYLVQFVVETPFITISIPLGVTVRSDDPFGSRVVVAVIDTGVNPYHATYQRPGINMPLDDFVDARTGTSARIIDLNFTGDYGQALASDAAGWDSIGAEELVYFAGTNVLAIDFDPSAGYDGIIDINGHGTATSDTVLDTFPEAIIVLVQTDALLLSDSLPKALQWAIEQPWIDVLSVSMGMPGNAPEPVYIYPIAKMARTAWESGKLWFESSGNDPSPLITDGFDGAPWAISVTGSHQGGQRKELNSSTVYPDIASDYTVLAASHRDATADRTISGTSFSCPTAAGTVAAAIYGLRNDAGWTGGIADGALVPPTGVTNADLRAAMNKSAILPVWDGTVQGGGDLGTPPYARFAEIGWGHVDGSIVDDMVGIVQSGDYSLPLPPAEKGVASGYMTATYAARLAYWLPLTSA